MQIIGIIEDFHFESLHEPIAPLIYFAGSDRSNYLFIRYFPGKLPNLLEKLKQKWKHDDFGSPFDPILLEDRVISQYSAENQVYRIVGGFLIIAALLALMGLISFSQSMTTRKVRELAIRKVYGADTATLIRTMMGYLLRWIVLASIIAVPIGIFLLTTWREQFTYRSPFNVWIIGVDLAIVIVTGAVVGLSQVLRVVKSNPGKILRYE
jgi:putative ABC transport system permease protein